MRWFCLAVTPLLFALAFAVSPSAGKDRKEPEKVEKKDSFLVVVPPTGGKEVKLADWKFTHGTRHFSLSGTKTNAPEYLEFREEKSTTYQNGILTLVPLASIRKIDYDRAKKTVAVIVVKTDDKDETLAGTTRFSNINKITLEADAILDGLGAATVKFQGGADKGLHSIAFPAPKAVAEAKGQKAVIIAADKEKTKHTVQSLQLLYLVDGGYRVLPYLMFKKTVKIDIDKIASLRFVPSEDKKKLSADFEVTLKDGMRHTLTLLPKIELEGKKSATFEGFVGQVPVGYKLFPPHTIYELEAGPDDEKK